MDIRFTSCCFGFLACLFVAPATYAQALPKTDYGGTVRLARVAEVSKAAIANSYNTVADYRYNSPLYGPAANDARYAQRGVTLGRISLGGMARAAAKSFRGPLTPIILAAQAAEWLHDEDGSATGTPGEFYREAGDQTVYWLNGSPGGEPCSNHKSPIPSSAASSCLAAASANDEFNTYALISASTESATFTQTHNNGHSEEHTLGVSSEVVEAPQEIISDSEMADAVEDNAPDPTNVARGLAGAAAAGSEGLDPSGQPQSNPVAEKWAELQEDLANQRDALEEAERAADTNEDGALSQQEIDAHNNQNPDQLPDAPPQPPPSQPAPVEVNIPTGCDLLPQLCQIRDWLLDPIPEEAPEPAWNVEQFGPADLPQASNPLPSGAAACPQPEQVTFFAEQISFSYQPYCDLAVMIKPLLLAAASLFAILLLVRM